MKFRGRDKEKIDFVITPLGEVDFNGTMLRGLLPEFPLQVEPATGQLYQAEVDGYMMSAIVLTANLAFLSQPCGYQHFAEACGDNIGPAESFMAAGLQLIMATRSRDKFKFNDDVVIVPRILAKEENVEALTSTNQHTLDLATAAVSRFRDAIFDQVCPYVYISSGSVFRRFETGEWGYGFFGDDGNPNSLNINIRLRMLGHPPFLTMFRSYFTRISDINRAVAEKRECGSKITLFTNLK